MRINLAVVLAVLCIVLCEISAQRTYYYNKPGQFLSDSIDEYVSENNETSPQYFENFPKNRPSRVKRCATCHCGWPNTNRIIGGTEVRYNKYPWIAQLKYDGEFYCGGSLINNLYIVTAAHCTTGFKANRISVRILQYNRNSGTQGISRKVVKIIAHPTYSSRTLNNDIALLKLDSSIPLTGTVRPVCLPGSAERFEGSTGIAAGWGLTEEGGKVSSILREVNVPIITNQECRKTRYKSMITDNMLCAGNVKSGGKDACQGDSGGPFITSSQSSYKLAGVVSFGYGCAQPNAPGVYARVTKFLKWIEDNTVDACYCNQ